MEGEDRHDAHGAPSVRAVELPSGSAAEPKGSVHGSRQE